MYRLRVSVLILAAVASGGALASTAVAGGWAVTTVDPIASALTPGSTVTVGYTIRQHGQRPVDLDDTGIEISSAGGAPAFFPGRRDGSVGHYTATITVPREASEWTVRQGWFGPQRLGAMPIDTDAATATPVDADPGVAQWVLLWATLLSAAALLAQMIVWRRSPAPAS